MIDYVPMPEVSISTVALACADAWDWLQAPSEEYLDVVGPGESDAMRRSMAVMSGCALVAAGYLRCLGVSDPHLEPPYHIGTAVSRLVRLAQEHDALETDISDVQVGDVVIVSGPEHVMVVLAVDDDETITTLDGGQVIAGHQAITRNVRVRTHDHVGARKVMYRINCDRLPCEGVRRIPMREEQ